MDAALQSVMATSGTSALLVVTAQDLRDFAHTLIDHTRRIVEAEYKEQYYSVSELATMLHVTKTTVYNFVRDGRLNATKVGRRTMFKRTEVQQALTEGRLGGHYQQYSNSQSSNSAQL